MKIYKHEYSSRDGKIKTFEVNVEEKPKSYTVTGRNAGVWESRILKENIGKLDGIYTKKMYTLTADTTEFLRAMVDRVETHIKYVKEDLEKSVNEKGYLLKLLDEITDRKDWGEG